MFRGEADGFPSLPRTTPLGSFLGWVSDCVESEEVEEGPTDDPSAIDSDLSLGSDDNRQRENNKPPKLKRTILPLVVALSTFVGAPS